MTGTICSTDFYGFAGIDWSGARGPSQPGIQLSLAMPGRGVPVSQSPDDGRHEQGQLFNVPVSQRPGDDRQWGRDEVLEWLVLTAESAPKPLLAGIDFAFAHPFHDSGSYYPCLGDSLPDAPSLWARVEKECTNAPHLYGGAMFTAPRLGDYYWSPFNDHPPRYACRRLRVTECAAKASAPSCTPSSTFKAIDKGNVATGSMAGMRLIHALRKKLGQRLAVWPFDRVTPENLKKLALVLVEIFPSYYFHRVHPNPARANAKFMTAALYDYKSDGVGDDYTPRGNDADESDAMISAAALRWFADKPDSWDAPPEAKQEGWIFGVTQSNDHQSHEKRNNFFSA